MPLNYTGGTIINIINVVLRTPLSSLLYPGTIFMPLFSTEGIIIMLLRRALSVLLFVLMALCIMLSVPRVLLSYLLY